MPSFAQILMGLGQGRGLKPNQRPFASQAASETLLRYLAPWEALNAVREQSANTMRQGITQATSAAQLNAALARQGAKDFGGLPANPLPYEGAPGSSAAIAATNRGLTREATIGMLATAANNAPIAAAQQIRQLRDKHADDLSQIGAQRGSLANQAGIFYSGRVGSLVSEDRKSRAAINAQKRSLENQLITSGVNPDGSIREGGPKDPALKPDAPGPYGYTKKEWLALPLAERQRIRKAAEAKKNGTPGGVKPQTPKQQGDFKDRVGGAQSIIAREDEGLRRSNSNLSAKQRRRIIAQDLLRGRGEQQIDDGGTKVKVPGVPRTGPLTSSVALDQFYDKHLSRRNVRELHKRGFSIKQLGFPTQPKRRTSVPTGLGGSIPLPPGT